MDNILITRKSNSIRSGFTLIELLVVIGIIGVLSGLLFAILNPTLQRNKAKDGVIKETLAKINKGVSTYNSTNLSVPSITALVSELGSAVTNPGGDCLVLTGFDTGTALDNLACGAATGQNNVFYYYGTTAGYEPGCVGTRGFSQGPNGRDKYYAMASGKIKSSDLANCAGTSGAPCSSGCAATCSQKNICMNWTDTNWVNEN